MTHANPTERRCIAVIGDFVRSRRTEDRDALQRALKGTLHLINVAFHRDLVAQFEIIRGDEYEGALANGAVIPEILERLLLEVTLHQRIGVGLGTVSTERSADPRAMDGTAFHNARKGIGPGKVNQRGGVFIGFSTGIFHGAEPPTTEGEPAEGTFLTRTSKPVDLDTLLSSNAEMAHHILSKLTKTQRRVLDLAVTHKSDREISEEMGISVQAVNRMRTGGGIRAYLNAISAQKSVLAKFDFRASWGDSA